MHLRGNLDSVVTCILAIKTAFHTPWCGSTALHIKGKVWDMAIEQFVAPHRGVRTNHSSVFSHMLPEACG